MTKEELMNLPEKSEIFSRGYGASVEIRRVQLLGGLQHRTRHFQC